ncbi:sensor histidine kinase [Psychromicrobium sp. YIM B11713]|uniref:sensor histidine kinase n=1 Tax=Psychromicrobium sp. YIM B11713 TaxID=3145233 RepID=UPI00374F13B1
MSEKPAVIGERAEPPVPWSYTFRDHLLKPLGLLFIASVSAAQKLLADKPEGDRFWLLYIPVALLSAASLFSWKRLPTWCQIVIFTGYLMLCGMLYALSKDNIAVLFSFVGSAIFGEKLASQRISISLAAANSLWTFACVWYLQNFQPQAVSASLWVALLVGLPVYIGLAQRNSREAYRQAHFALQESQRAADAEAREAALAERSRIAREVHDVVGHSLTGISLQLDMADALHRRGREVEANQAVVKARALAVGGIAETRRAVQALRQQTLPLTETLRVMARNEAAEFIQRGAVRQTSVETSQALIRAAQEAMTNAQRYAGGAALTVSLCFDVSSIRLRVFNGPAVGNRRSAPGAGSGMGLIGMRERADLLGGALHAGPEGDGWLVEMELPG